MAILVEEEGQKVSITSILMWLTVLGVIAVAAYYIFFANPEIVDVAMPAAFQNIDPLSQVNLAPEDVIDGTPFQSLELHVTMPEPGNSGRSNPFAQP